MVANYSDTTKLKHAKMIAKQGGCFIVERGGYDNKEFILYRENPHGSNFRIGKRSTIDGICRWLRKQQQPNPLDNAEVLTYALHIVTNWSSEHANGRWNFRRLACND